MSEAAQTAGDATPDSMQPGALQADAGFLWDFWYPAMRSDEIYGEQPFRHVHIEVRWVQVHLAHLCGESVPHAARHSGELTPNSPALTKHSL